MYELTLQSNNVHKYRQVQTGEPLLSKFVFDNPYDNQPVQFYGMIKDGGDKTGKISHLKILINGSATIEIPAELKEGNKIYSDGKNIYVCDNNWYTLLKYPCTSSALWSKGKNQVSVQCDFSSPNAPVVDLEFKALGNKEQITGKKRLDE